MGLTTLFYLCKFSSYFGLIFLMLITAELFPTSLRCTGMGLCFSLKMFGSFIASDKYLAHNSTMHRLGFCLLTLFFGSMCLFLPETKTFPLPRSILQIEAMPTAIGKKLRSRKVKMACEGRQMEMTGDYSANQLKLVNNNNNTSQNNTMNASNNQMPINQTDNHHHQVSITETGKRLLN